MKKSLAVITLLLAVVTFAQNSEWTKLNPVTPLTAKSFAQPPMNDWPWVRMNLPATADPVEIAAEVRDLHEKGIGGVEVGQGAFPNNEQLVALYTTANSLGMKVSLSHGPTQNLAGYSIDSDHARKTLFFGKAVVEAGGTFEGALPPGTLTVVGKSGFGGIGGGRGPAASRVGAAPRPVVL